MILCAWGHMQDHQDDGSSDLSASKALCAIQQGRQQVWPAPLARRIGATRIELVEPLIWEWEIMLPNDALRIEQIAIPGDPIPVA